MSESKPLPGQQVPLTDRVRGETFPSQLPKLASNKVLARKGSLDRPLGVVLGAAVGEALGRSASDPADSVGVVTTEAVLEAQAFISVGRLDVAELAASFRSLRSQAEREGGPSSVEGDAVCAPLGRASFAVARWSFVNPAGSAEVARRFARITTEDPTTIEARAVLHSLMCGAVPRAKQPDPFRTPDHMGGESATAHVLEPIPAGHREVFAPVINMTDLHSTHLAPLLLAQAIRAVRTTNDFASCVELAANTGEHAACVAAIAGMIAGAIYGAAEIPAALTARLGGQTLDVECTSSGLEALLLQVLEVQQPKTG